MATKSNSDFLEQFALMYYYYDYFGNGVWGTKGLDVARRLVPMFPSMAVGVGPGSAVREPFQVGQ